MLVFCWFIHISSTLIKSPILVTVVCKICWLSPASSYSPTSDWTDDQFLLELISRICASDLFRPLYSNCISLNRWVDQYLGTWHINYLGIGLVRLIQLGSSRPQVPLQWDREKIIGYKWSTDTQRISIQKRLKWHSRQLGNFNQNINTGRYII